MTNTAICYRKFGRISSHLASSDIYVANNANTRQTLTSEFKINLIYFWNNVGRVIYNDLGKMFAENHKLFQKIILEIFLEFLKIL